MLSELSIQNWLSILFSLIVFTGPGWLGIRYFPKGYRLDFTSKSIFAFCLSLGIWTFSLSILRFFPRGLSKESIIIIFSLIWLIILIGTIQSLRNDLNFSFDIYQIILWIFFFSVIFIILFTLRSIVTGLGSDSYHHSLISKLIFEQGKAPNNYLPYAPLVSFSYHFGFHSLVAFIATISGVPVELLVPITGTIVIGLTSLSCYFIAIQLFKDKFTALTAGIIVICITASPFYLINFSRFPQLLGLLYCSVFLGFFVLWEDFNYSKTLIPYFSIIAIGQAFAHYRVTIMSAIGILLYIIFVKHSESKTGKKISFVQIKSWIYSGLLTILLFLPWAIQIYFSSKLGISGDIGEMSANFFNINRIGSEMIHYPTNIYIYFLLILSLIVNLWIREWKIFWLFSWTLLLFLLSSRYLFNLYMDTVSTVFSIFIPIALISGWSIRKIFFIMEKNAKLKSIFLIASMAIVLYCVHLLPQYIHPEYSFVTQEDQNAFKWINSNLPKPISFIVNTYNFNFNENYIIGIDAGYWIPYFTGNKTVSIPMIYLIERVVSKQVISNLQQIHKLPDFTSTENIDVILDSGYSYIYLGEKGSKNNLEELENSNFYELIYNSSNTYIFRIKPRQ